MELLRATWILFLSHLRRTVFSKRALLCLGLALVPLAFALLVRRLSEMDDDVVPVLDMSWFLHTQVVVPLIALIAGSAVVAEEVEDRTITYLLTRPIPRAAILFGRWLASVLLVLFLCGLSIWLFLGILAPVVADDPEFALTSTARTRLMTTALVGSAVYSALFATIGTFLKWPVIVGLGYTFAIEGFLANLPGGNQAITIQYYLKSYMAGGELTALAHLSKAMREDLVPAGEALWTLGIVGVVALVLGGWILSRRQYVLPS